MWKMSLENVSMVSYLSLLTSLALLVLVLSSQSADPPAESKLPAAGAKPVDLTGIHNVIHVSDKLYSGSAPEGKEAFETLKKLGIKTILSVDGAKPDVKLAKDVGLKYVHMPIGYDGVSQEMAVKLAKAVRDLDGPIYIHCHHGKHRSPGAAAAIRYCLDDKCTVAQAVDIMKRAGTDPKYKGLFDAPNALKRPSKEDLDKLKIEFPEVAVIPALAGAMVEIDERWDHLGLIRKANWLTPKNHPDLDPPHEALQLFEHYRELARRPEIVKREKDFKAWLADSEKASAELEAALRDKAKPDTKAAEKAYQSVRSLCADCHAKYRDVPQKP